MKLTIRNCFFALAMSVLIVSMAAAQELHVGHVQSGPLLPPALTFTNCGTGCTSYNTGSGYFVSGTANTTTAGQVLAVEFDNKGKPITKVIEANAAFTAVHTLGAVLLKGEPNEMIGGAVLGGTLRVVGSCPPATGSAPCTYKPRRPVKTGTGTKDSMWLCQYWMNADKTGAGLWMLSISDTANDDFAFVNGASSNGTCLNETWSIANGAIRPAFEIN